MVGIWVRRRARMHGFPPVDPRELAENSDLVITLAGRARFGPGRAGRSSTARSPIPVSSPALERQPLACRIFRSALVEPVGRGSFGVVLALIGRLTLNIPLVEVGNRFPVDSFFGRLAAAGPWGRSGSCSAGCAGCGPPFISLIRIGKE